MDLSQIAHDPAQPLFAGQEHRELPSYHPSHPSARWRLDQSRYVHLFLERVSRRFHSVRTSPLLSFLHFTFAGPNNINNPPIELDLEEVKALVREMGFRLSVRLFFLLGPWLHGLD